VPEVRYGTAGWVFDDWYGPFYPTKPPAAEGPGALFSGVPDPAPDPDLVLARRQPLRYYARFFDVVEVNSSFYGIPAPATTERWATQTEGVGPRPFLFSLKLPSVFTHEGWLEGPEVQAFRDCLAPLLERGRLAAVLAQFPHSLHHTAPACERLERIRAAFPDLPMAVELRHTSWKRDATWELARRLDVSLAWIDQPQDASTLGPEVGQASPGLAYVRLHGRNAPAWFDPQAGRDAKYDYLYTPDEVRDWGQRIQALTQLSERTLVIANNHFRGQAPANALELRRLGGERVTVPGPLLAAYPRLAVGS
jgi:uncharacterized protein YecE (DUF72 family)